MANTKQSQTPANKRGQSKQPVGSTKQPPTSQKMSGFSALSQHWDKDI